LNKPVLYVVHCIDTEGPMDEDIYATFQRIGELFNVWLEPSEKTLKQLQNMEIKLNGKEQEIAQVISPKLLNYNRSWDDIEHMLNSALSEEFRNQLCDDFDNGWVYSWHCVDHMGFAENPRRKDIGYGKIFDFYQNILDRTNSHQDELNWHFHPLSLTGNPLSAATSYNNNMSLLLDIIARRIIEHQWFPTTSRPGFHSERPDSHAFMEQWIPFDYANQSIKGECLQQNDTECGRFGDWRWAPQNWLGYHPHHDDYQQKGNCRRWIFRCLNLGTRLRLLTREHLVESFNDARSYGSAIVAFANHDYRDIRPDVQYMRELIAEVRQKYPDVQICFAGAEEAARRHIERIEPEVYKQPPVFKIHIQNGRLHVYLDSGSLFGPQPFLAIKSRDGHYFHDNFDVIKNGQHWSYVFDEHTLKLNDVDTVGVGGAGQCGGYHVALYPVD